MPKSEKSIDLGKLQSNFEGARKKFKASDRALKRAQDSRNSSKKELEAAEAALRQASQAVLD